MQKTTEPLNQEMRIQVIEIVSETLCCIISACRVKNVITFKGTWKSHQILSMYLCWVDMSLHINYNLFIQSKSTISTKKQILYNLLHIRIHV